VQLQPSNESSHQHWDDDFSLEVVAQRRDPSGGPRPSRGAHEMTAVPPPRQTPPKLQWGSPVPDEQTVSVSSTEPDACASVGGKLRSVNVCTAFGLATRGAWTVNLCQETVQRVDRRSWGKGVCELQCICGIVCVRGDVPSPHNLHAPAHRQHSRRKT
jgi:hypothetical protein